MPVKRALVCGVPEYGHLQASKIPGASTAAQEWATRLERYGYQNVVPWIDSRVTKAWVLAQLRKMFEDSGPEDDVMFIIACHGTSIPRDDAGGEEQGLVLYPEEGDTLLDATLFGPEIAEAAKAAKHGEKTHFNVVLDCCFGGGINPPPPPLLDRDEGLAAVLRRAVPLRIIPPGGSRGAATAFVNSLRETLAESSKPSTVVIAACGATELAYEGEANDGRQWTFFSYAALKALSNDPNHSYGSLVKDGVTPYLGFQHPVCEGDRCNYNFARRTIRQRPGGTVPPAANTGAAAAVTSMTTTPQVTLDVLILGISCIANPQTGGPLPKRVLFPTDNLWYPSHPPHVAFLEVEEEDLLYDPGTIGGLSERYTRFGRYYRRFELSSHKITIDNIDTTQGFYEKSVYRDHVPKMKNVQPDLSTYPKADCYLEKPPADLIAGYFDIAYGILGVRRVASYLSYFSPPPPPNTLPNGYFAISPQLRVKINDEAPTIRVTNLDTGYVSKLILKPTATEISIGNLTAPTLAGYTKEDDPPHDSKLFYNLAVTPVDPMPVPSKPQGIETACIPVGWP